MDISEITSALSAAAPYGTAITALANLGIDITKVLTPDVAQQLANEHQARIQKAAQLVSELLAAKTPDDNSSAIERLDAYDSGLCAQAGYPIAGGMAETCITVRVSRYLAHVAAVSADIRDAAIIGQLTLDSASKQVITAPATTTK